MVLTSTNKVKCILVQFSYTLCAYTSRLQSISMKLGHFIEIDFTLASGKCMARSQPQPQPQPSCEHHGIPEQIGQAA